MQGNYTARARKHVGWKINTYKVLIWKPDGLFETGRICEDNIKIDVTEMSLEVCGLDSFGPDEIFLAGFFFNSVEKFGIS